MFFKYQFFSKLTSQTNINDSQKNHQRNSIIIIVFTIIYELLTDCKTFFYCRHAFRGKRVTPSHCLVHALTAFYCEWLLFLTIIKTYRINKNENTSKLCSRNVKIQRFFKSVLTMIFLIIAQASKKPTLIAIRNVNISLTCSIGIFFTRWDIIGEILVSTLKWKCF